MTDISIHNFSTRREDDRVVLTVELDCGSIDRALRFLSDMSAAPTPEPAKEPIDQEVFVVRDTASKEIVSSWDFDRKAAMAACKPGQEVVSSLHGLQYVMDVRFIANPPTVAGEFSAPSEPEESRPGMDPAKVLAAYDQIHTETTANDAPEKPAKQYTKGGTYDGVEITRVQTSRAQGFGVLTLASGAKVKFDLASGEAIDVRQPLDPTLAEERAAIQAVEREADERIAAEEAREPASERPEWLGAVQGARGLKAALEAALKHVSRSEIVDWSMGNRDDIPAFKRVATEKLQMRIERVLSAIPAEAAQ
jgi:hypothetical protein